MTEIEVTEDRDQRLDQIALARAVLADDGMAVEAALPPGAVESSTLSVKRISKSCRLRKQGNFSRCKCMGLSSSRSLDARSLGLVC